MHMWLSQLLNFVAFEDAIDANNMVKKQTNEYCMAQTKTKKARKMNYGQRKGKKPTKGSFP